MHFTRISFCFARNVLLTLILGKRIKIAAQMENYWNIEGKGGGKEEKRGEISRIPFHIFHVL